MMRAVMRNHFIFLSGLRGSTISYKAITTVIADGYMAENVTQQARSHVLFTDVFINYVTHIYSFSIFKALEFYLSHKHVRQQRKVTLSQDIYRYIDV